jgi:anti-sigma factor RsiW
MRRLDALRGALWARRIRQAGDITCRRVVELMTEYLEDALAPDERERFEVHLRHCDACARYLEQLRAAIAVLGAVPADEPDPAVREELVGFYRRFRRS